MSLAAPLIGATRFLVGGRALWLGCRPTPAKRIYFANHTSHLDTLVLWAALPERLRALTRPVAAADYWGRTRLHRFVAEDILGAVLIERGKGADALIPLNDALKDGASLIVFPEGTRGAGPLPGPFKSGLFHLARQNPDAELIPVWLDGLQRAFPKGVFLPVPITSTALFGTPLRPEPGEDRDVFLTRARGEIVALAQRQGGGAGDV